MSSETRDTPHLSGTGLLAYIRENGIDINNLKFGKVPRILLKSHGEDTSVNVIVVDLLLDDKKGIKAKKFADMCPEYKEARPIENKNTSELIGLFQRFVQDILLPEADIASQSRDIRERGNTDNESDDMQEIEALYQNLDHDLDRWWTTYHSIVDSTGEYLKYLEQEFDDPEPESWRQYDDREPDEAEVCYIPNKYLNILLSVINFLRVRAENLGRKIENKKWWHLNKYKKNNRESLCEVLQLVLDIKALRWNVFDKYNQASTKISELIHSINVILDENK